LVRRRLRCAVNYREILIRPLRACWKRCWARCCSRSSSSTAHWRSLIRQNVASPS